MQKIDDDVAHMIRLMFDRDPAVSYLARTDLYLAVLRHDERLDFIDGEIEAFLALHETFTDEAERAGFVDLVFNNKPVQRADFVAIVRGLVARRRALIGDGRKWAA